MFKILFIVKCEKGEYPDSEPNSDPKSIISDLDPDPLVQIISDPGGSRYGTLVHKNKVDFH